MTGKCECYEELKSMAQNPYRMVCFCTECSEINKKIKELKDILKRRQGILPQFYKGRRVLRDNENKAQQKTKQVSSDKSEGA